MAEEATRYRNPAGHAGLLENLLALAVALAGFFESRFALFFQESKAALIQVLCLAACLIAAVMLFAFGYIFLVASIVVGIAHAVQVSWIWIALGAAVMHFLVALIFVLVARSRVTKPLFRATASELKKDSEWLKNLHATSRPRN
jgi:uncharacterized membrane protein YqjE